MTEQWLLLRSPIFGSNYLEPRVLMMMIRKNIHKIDCISDDNDDNNYEYLYRAGESSRKFILILEGCVTVYFPENKMKFEVGSWEYFGKGVIDGIEHAIINNFTRGTLNSIFSGMFYPSF